MRVIVAPDGVSKVATCYQTPFGYIACPDYHLLCIYSSFIRIRIEIAGYGINLNNLIDIPRHNAVVIAFFLHILIIFECAFIDKEQCPVDIRFNGAFIGREREEQFVKSSASPVIRSSGTPLARMARHL